MEESTQLEEEQTMPTTMEHITSPPIERLIAVMEKLTALIDKSLSDKSSSEKSSSGKSSVERSFAQHSPLESPQVFIDKPNFKVRRGREVWEKYIQMCNSKNNPKLWNSQSLIYGVYKLPNNASNSGEGAGTRIEFFPETNEGILIDDQGVSGESILEKAAQGNFTQVMKLKELQQHTPAGEFPIERIMATLWYSTCEPSKRKLIHWVAYHNQLEILDWMLESSVIFPSDNPYERKYEENDQEVYEVLQQNKADRQVGEGDQQAELDIPQVEEDNTQVEQNNQPILDGNQRVKMQSGSQKSVATGSDHTYRKNANIPYGFLPIDAKDSLNAQDLYGYTPLHLATIENHEGIVKSLFAEAYDDLLAVHIAAENMLALEGNERNSNKLSALHFAARNKSSLPIVQMLLEKRGLKYNYALFKGGSIIELKSSSGKTPLHYASQYGNWEVVKQLLEVSMEFIYGSSKSEYVNDRDVFRRTPLYLAASNNQVEVVEILLRDVDGLNMNTVTWEGISALDIAKRNEDQQTHKEKKKVSQRIVDMLESYDVNWLISERQKYANAASFLLVGAALIAGVTYAGWLQPPLGLTQYYDFPSSSSAAPPETYDSYVGVEQHWEIQTFWVFNSMAFFCSIATFIFGAAAGIPKKCASLREEVVQLRKSVVRASFVLAVAILFAIGAFASAGIIVLPPIARQRAPTYATVAVGVAVCMKLLVEFILKLWIWFRSPSLLFKMVDQDPSTKLYTSGSRWVPKHRIEVPVYGDYN
ncbi:hypothetical protein KC19_9G079200 [Ceratodon purpureus]|uniref:PGG domain-containing protein n=1 Tax=Ceratodon purpureus TaxID=3225 RepID=A0A8T0GPU2_CERPU|nr:hypothetical protein KC19_9G079200 [Ceratodon purpureus]